MNTTALRQLTANVAKTVRGATVWPNGIGFSVGNANYVWNEQHGFWVFSPAENTRPTRRAEASAAHALSVGAIVAVENRRPRSSGVRQTACRHCGQDIEGVAPYRRGEWRDRGNNAHCPTPEGDNGRFHAPVLEGRS